MHVVGDRSIRSERIGGNQRSSNAQQMRLYRVKREVEIESGGSSLGSGFLLNGQLRKCVDVGSRLPAHPSMASTSGFAHRSFLIGAQVNVVYLITC